MDPNEFIVTLPSNSSSKLYSNTKSNFKTKLITPIRISENTIVGLKEIIFPLEFNTTIGKVSIKNSLKTVTEKISTQAYSFKSFPKFITEQVDLILFKAGAGEFIGASNGGMKFFGLIFENKTGRYSLTLRSGYTVKFEGLIAKLLGFPENKEIGTITGDDPAPISLIDSYDIPSILYIYTDIIEFQYVGDTKAQLIATIPVNLKQNEKICSFTFVNPLFYDVNTNKIESIHITIKDDQNKFIKFKDGENKVLIKLEFKQKNIKQLI